ncbi:MAG: large conductance mechanosensitive channel protein MscL [Erysipelothrix sp.]|nr:large conductance mechanosensitive channel protein MscL [Erysipelothrix sp.]
MKKFMSEFKEFALKGNVFDLAIGVVIGGAFTAIVTSLVTDIITPLLSVIANTENIENLQFILKKAVVENGVVIKEATVLRYGSFIDAVISFLIIALIIFSMISMINKLSRAKEAEVVEELAPEPSQETVLLEEILNELRKSNK